MFSQVLIQTLFLFCNNCQFISSIDEGQEFWRHKGAYEMAEALAVKYNNDVAKNVIVFIGDGMGLTTTTSARVYAKGDGGFLAWEKFNHMGLLKTYSNNKLVPDSGSTATALFCGVKSNQYTIGVDARVKENDCNASLDASTHTKSILDWGIKARKSTGFVTTTRVTHATPAALYAHCANRRWECGTEMPEYASKCKDIGRQLVEDIPGRYIKVIMGGGRQALQFNSSEGADDRLDTNGGCVRGDRRDLLAAWAEDKKKRKKSHAIISNTEELVKLKDTTEFVLGIFANSHLASDFNRNKEPKGMPSLRAMTEKAIKLLRKDKNGFILAVESGLIDLAHHAGHARWALDETRALSDAIEGALRLVDRRKTLIIVTSDHAHGLAYVGYPSRKDSIFGMAKVSKVTNIPFTSLLYAVGNKENFQYTAEKPSSMRRRDPSQDKTDDYKYFQQTGILDNSVPHGGSDVLIYATGPRSHLVHSVREQTFVAYLVSYAAQIGPAKIKKVTRRSTTNSSAKHNNIIIIMTLIFIDYCIFNK